MKLYKKYKNDIKGKQYHELAKKYLELNKINVKYYCWYGMANNVDIVKTDKGYFHFDINTKKKTNLKYDKYEIKKLKLYDEEAEGIPLF